MEEKVMNFKKNIMIGVFVFAISLIFYAQTIQNLIIDVKNEGAKADGTNDDTVVIQKAIDKCAENGGGTILLSKGVYLSGPLFLKSRTTLKIDDEATLLATTDPKSYEGTNYKRNTLSLIMGDRDKSINDVVITGNGKIDGQGAIWWKRFQESGNKLERPRLIYIGYCKNLKIENVTMINSPSFHIVPLMCSDVTVDNVKITSSRISPNTDGIDPSRSKNIRISNCTIDTGDDDIAIKSDKPKEGTELTPCENIEISNCTILSGHGISIGSETFSGVKNMVVKNVVFRGTTNGIRIKSLQGRGGEIHNITYSDITMSSVSLPIIISFTYSDKNKNDSKDKIQEGMPSLQDVSFINMKIKYASNAGSLIGLPDSMLENIKFENVDISSNTGMTIKNAKNIEFKNVVINIKNGKQLATDNVTGGVGLPAN
jgi:polygalacturonase